MVVTQKPSQDWVREGVAVLSTALLLLWKVSLSLQPSPCPFSTISALWQMVGDARLVRMIQECRKQPERQGWVAELTPGRIRAQDHLVLHRKDKSILKRTTPADSEGPSGRLGGGATATHRSLGHSGEYEDQWRQGLDTCILWLC